MTARRSIGGAVFGLMLLLSAAAESQQPVVTSPTPGTVGSAGNASGTIGSTGVWQQVWAAANSIPGTPSRRGCTIQNNGSNNQYVTEGLGTASSTTAKAVTLNPGQTFYCHWAGSVLVGEIDISGTAGDAFYAGQE